MCATCLLYADGDVPDGRPTDATLACSIGGLIARLAGIVAIKVLDPSGSWVAIYQEKPLLHEYQEFMSTNTYWDFAPAVCRGHFKTRSLRIEVDTSSETGVEDWNYSAHSGS